MQIGREQHLYFRGPEDLVYGVRLKSVAANTHTEFKGCEESIDMCVSQRTAMPNMILKYVCGLPVTFPAALIILTSLFLFFSAPSCQTKHKISTVARF